MLRPLYTLALSITVSFAMSGLMKSAAHADVLRPTQKTITAHDDAVRKINLTGRQAMYVEHIAKSMCFAQNGVKTSDLLNQVMQAQWLFQSTSTQLREGDQNQSLLPEKHPEILAAFDAVDALWLQYNDNINTWLAQNGKDTNSLLAIDKLSLDLIEQIHNAEKLIEKVYHDEGAVTLDTEWAIETFDHMRMMTQKMSKEYCFTSFDLNPEENRIQLQSTMTKFMELMASVHNRPAAASDWTMPSEALAELSKVESEFKILSPVLASTAAGESSTSPEYMELTIQQGLLMMTQLDSAIYHIEKLR